MGVWHGVPEGKCSNAHTPITDSLDSNTTQARTHKCVCHVPTVSLMLRPDVCYASVENLTRTEDNIISSRLFTSRLLVFLSFVMLLMMSFLLMS